MISIHIKHSAQIIKNSNCDCTQAVLLTDLKSVLKAYQNNKLPDLENILYEISTENTITLQWILSHWGIPDNEAADCLAKEGAKKEQFERENSGWYPRLYASAKKQNNQASKYYNRASTCSLKTPGKSSGQLQPLCKPNSMDLFATAKFIVQTGLL